MNTGLLDAARQSVEVLRDRVAGILRTQNNLSRPANSRWSVRDITAHLVATTGLSTEIALGTRSDVCVFTPEAVSEANFARIADIAEADPHVLATMLTAAAERFLEATRDRPDDDPVVYYDRIPLQLTPISGILTGEYVLHDYDIAATCNVPWPVDPGQAVALGVVRFNGKNPDLAAGFLDKLYSF